MKKSVLFLITFCLFLTEASAQIPEQPEQQPTAQSLKIQKVDDSVASTTSVFSLNDAIALVRLFTAQNEYVQVCEFTTNGAFKVVMREDRHIEELLNETHFGQELENSGYLVTLSSSKTSQISSYYQPDDECNTCGQQDVSDVAKANVAAKAGYEGEQISIQFDEGPKKEISAEEKERLKKMMEALSAKKEKKDGE